MLSNKLGALALGAIVGTVLMYALDPVSGRRRRALAVDKMNKYKNKVHKYSSKKTRDISNRAEGLLAEAQNMLH